MKKARFHIALFLYLINVIKNVDADYNRFKEIIKGHIRKDFKKYIKNHKMIGKQGDKRVTIPVSRIEQPRLIFDPQNSGGVSRGDGDVGDVIIDENDSENKNGDKAGKDAGEHTYNVEMSIEELATMLGEHLQLPKLQHKNIGDSIKTESKKYSSTNKTGPSGLQIYRRTLKHALIRAIISKEYNPKKPVIIPHREDFIYKYPKTAMKPDAKAVIFYIMDVSGSMSETKRDIVCGICYWLDLWLQNSYKNNLETRYIVHDVKAIEVSKEYFYKINTSGGTFISTPVKLCNEIIDNDYDPELWNIYVYQFSDGDTWNNDDVNETIRIVNDELFVKVNMYNYCEISGLSETNTFISSFNRRRDLDKTRSIRIQSKSQIDDVIVEFFDGKSDK